MPLPWDARSAQAPLVIVSGGQTGVDRAALDAALDHSVPCSGWCPEGRQAADGAIDARYPLHVLAGAGYRARTRQNVYDTDATIILFFDTIVEGGGTELTVRACQKSAKPWLEIDAARVTPNDAAVSIYDFCLAHKVRLLNIAGPRAVWSYEAAYRIISSFLQRATSGHSSPVQS